MSAITHIYAGVPVSHLDDGIEPDDPDGNAIAFAEPRDAA